MLPSRDSFEKPTGDTLVAGAVVVGAVLLLIVMARVFKDVSPT